MVTERMKYFREKFRGWSLISEVVELTDKRVVIKATAYDDKDRPRATGLACENSDSSFNNPDTPNAGQCANVSVSFINISAIYGDFTLLLGLLINLQPFTRFEYL